MLLETIASVVILIGAVCVAITNIWKFFANGRKSVQEHVEQHKTEQETDFNNKVDARVKEVVAPMLD